MILKASQRGGARQLARHLLRTDENDHVEVVSVRGVMSRDLMGALTEAEAIARGTRCKQYLFSLSLNPPLDSGATPDDLLDAVLRAEQALGLSNQPRAIVFHEKRGRMHAHAVWSRIDPVTLKAVPMSFFKTRLAALSKGLFLEHGWDLPEGHKENGWKSPDSFSLGEWQQAKRLDLDPRELKQLFRAVWAQSDNLTSFRQALAARGYSLARGDRRGFVAVDVQGEVFSVARMLGIKTKDLATKLGTPDGLPTVAMAKASLGTRLGDNFRAVIKEAKRSDRLELAPLRASRCARISQQRRIRNLVPVAPVKSANGRVAVTGPQLRQRLPHRSCSAYARPSVRKPPTGTIAVIPFAPCRTSRGEPSVFIRSQLPDESYEDYMAYKRACFRLIAQQLEERSLDQQKIEAILTAQRARRMALIARMAQLIQQLPPGRNRGMHP